MIALLVAYTKNERIIGAQGKIPWNLSSERRRFKQICNGQKVIMGRKTFEEIGHALPYCTIVIISNTMKLAPEGCLLGKLDSSGEKLKIILQNGDILEDNLLIAGGGDIYRKALPFADTIYATEIESSIKGDTTFPPLDNTWQKVESIPITDDFLQYNYVTYKKAKA